MIFKTFNNDIDKISAKWGIFGKSFNDIGTAISGKISDINKNFQVTDDLIGSIKNSGDSIWARLYPTKEQIASLEINVPELIDTTKANEYLNIMKQIDAGIHPVFKSYQDWHDELADGEKWIAKHAQSTKGQIRSLNGVTEANQQARQSALAHNEALKQQTLSAKATSVAMNLLSTAANMLVMYAISKLITAWDDYKRKLREVAQETAEQAEKSSANAQSLLDLQEKLDDNTVSAEDLTTAFREQMRTMGYTEEEIDNLINKYNGLAGAIKGATEEALNNAKTDAYADMSTSGRSLTVEAKGNTNVGTYYSQNKELSKEIRKMLDESTAILDGGIYRMDKNASAEDIYSYYLTLKDISQLIQETAKETGDDSLLAGDSINPTPYYQVSEALDALSESAELYGDAVNRLHNADAQLELSNYLKTNDIDSKEAFDSYIDGIKNNTTYSETYKQVLLEVANDAFPQFSAAAKDASDSLSGFPDKITVLDISSTVEKLNTQLKPTIDSLSSAYNNIFTTDGFTRENIGLDMFSSIKDELDNLQKSLEESGSSAVVDYSAYEKLVSVLNDADSSVQQIKDAFDEVALSVANVSITGLEDFQVLKESLEQLGYVDADLVAFETLVSNMEALKAAGLDLADTSLTESDFISFVDSLGISAEYATQAVNMLTFAQELNKAESLDTSGSVSELLDLAQNAGYTGEIIQWLTRLMEIYKRLESGFLDPHTIQDYVFEAQQITTKIQESAGKINIAPNERTIDWKPLQKAAGKAGKDAGKTYKEELEEELSSLGDVINYIGDIISEQVDLWEDAKDAAVDALEAEKQAAEDALQAQIDLVEAQIEAIEDQIEAKEKEIEKIQDARKERDLELASQKALYEWNRQMSQKTRLIYKEGNDGVPGQMVYETDSKGIRDAKEEYDRTQEDLEINRIEKEIKILEEEIEGLEDIIDGLNDQIDLSNNYYDNLIKQTEAYYDSMIKGLEDYKNRWDELAEIEEQAKMNVKLQELGIETADILNMSEEAFNSFKNQYLSILTEMYNGETDMVNAINSVAQGLDTTALETGLTKTKENIDKLNTADFTSVKTGLDNVSSSINSVGSSAITTSSNVDSMTDSLNEANLAKKELLNVASELEGMTSLKQVIDTVVDSVNQKTDAFEKEKQKVSEVVQSEITELESLDANINTVTNSISLMNESSVGINSLAESCTSLGEAIANIAKSLGVEGGSVSGLVTALQDLSTISLMGEDGQSGILSQFYMLKTAIDSVTSAVNGGGAMNVDGGGASSGSTGAASQTGSGQGGFGGLTGAIREIGTVTDETIGGSGENSESSEKGEGSASNSEGDGVLGKFGAFKESVDAVTQAIGTGEEEEGSEEGASTLIGALQLHYEKAQETLPEVKNMFQELLDKILECIAALSELAGAMSSLSGSGVGFAEGTVGSAFVNGTVGKAFAKGTSRFKGLTKDESFTIRSEYGQPELTVHPNGIVEYTDTPTVAPLKKDTVIFNEQQTKKILNNNHGKFIGNAYESGTESKLPILNREEMSQLDFIVEATRRFKELKLTAPEELMRPIGGIYENTEKMLESINSINTNKYNTGISVGEVHVHCSGITSKEVAEEAALQTFNELQKATFGLSNAARQHNTTVNKYY